MSIEIDKLKSATRITTRLAEILIEFHTKPLEQENVSSTISEIYNAVDTYLEDVLKRYHIARQGTIK